VIGALRSRRDGNTEHHQGRKDGHDQPGHDYDNPLNRLTLIKLCETHHAPPQSW